MNFHSGERSGKIGQPLNISEKKKKMYILGLNYFNSFLIRFPIYTLLEFK